MDLSGRRIWQIAAGDGTERNYPDVLLEWDIVAIGVASMVAGRTERRSIWKNGVPPKFA